jgi:stringent starvation protein B
MPDGGSIASRLQEIFTALVQRSISDSLGRVEEALAGWRRGQRSVLAAHAEVLRHAARTNVLSNRVARAALEGPETLLRDAFDAGLIAREELESLTRKKAEEIAPSPSLDDEAARAGNPEMPAKKNTLEKLMRDGPVLVHLDPRRVGVDVPAQHRGEPRLVLRFGYGLTPPIVDLVVEDSLLAGTLTFRGVPHRCVIPWTAVFAVVGDDGRGLVWGEDVPPEIAHEYTRDARATAKKQGELRERDAERSASPAAPAGAPAGKPERPERPDRQDRPEPPEPDPPRGKRGHLKLV